MAEYDIPVLGEGQVSITGGVTLDGVTQGDGSHLVGESITLTGDVFTTLDITDVGTDTTFDDNDGNQRLDGAQTLDGVTYADGTQIEAEYRLILRDNSTGETYEVVAVNLNNSSPTFGTIEGLAFVGELPPIGVSLEVVEAFEGPGSGSQPPVEEETVVCFCKGVRIRTPQGDVAVEDLAPGQIVESFEGEPKAIRWIGRRRFDGRDLRNNRKLYPVRITQGALGGGLPARDMLVSRQHRMYVASKIVERMFGCADVLIPAFRLTDLPGVFVDDGVDEVEYFHVLLDDHDVIVAEGAPTESLFTGQQCLDAIGEEARKEIQAIFPEVFEAGFAPRMARHVPRGKQQKKLVERHLKNNKPFVSI